jgi:phosphoserine phosphatase RsbU/P
MKLRTALFAAITLLIAAIVAATVFAIVTVVGRAERRNLDAELVRSREVFEELLGSRQNQLRSDCHVVANEPRLRATVATQDITHETVLGVANELRRSLGSDLFLITDGEGYLLADSLDPSAHGFDMSKQPVLASAIQKGDGGAVWITANLPYLVHACRVDFGAQVAGVILVGDLLDDAFAQAIHRQTGSTLVLALDGARVAASALREDQAVPDRVDDIARDVSADIREARIGAAGYATVGGALPRYDGKRTLRYVLLRSIDDALAPGRRLTRSIMVIAGIALMGGLAVAGLLSRRLSRPVDDLVLFTNRIARGNLEERAKPVGVVEVKALATAMNVMVQELDKSRRDLAAKERLEREMEIAMRIQTSILPRSFDIHGLDIAARMFPATEVGGDYYDVLRVPGGCWIGIGDVAGHGLTAGLEMMMVQSVISALIRENAGAEPSAHLSVLNQVVYENIRHRLQQDEHITLTLMRYLNGTLTFAGAHETILVCRAGTGACELIETPGTWLGAMPDISRFTTNTTLDLAPGDLMVLYSDGLTEARNRANKQFSLERVASIAERNRDRSVEEIRDAILADWTEWRDGQEQDDDVSLVVVRRDPAVG